METCVINNELISEHELYAKCPSTLREVSERDYPRKNYFSKNDILCLDMDTYEKNVLKTASPEETVDAVIGISSYRHNETKNSRLLLIELRMGYDNADNLDRQQHIDKVAHTRTLLGYETPIDNTSLFIFKDDVYPEAEYQFERWRNQYAVYKNFETCSVSSFQDVIKSAEDMPYEPIHNETQIRSELSQFRQKDDKKSFINKIKTLLQEALIYQKHPYEFNFLKELIQEEWKPFREANPVIQDEDIEIDALIVEEDISVMFKD